MTQRIIRKASLTGAFILGTALFASSAPAAGWVSPRPKIIEVRVDFAAQEIIIIGRRFDIGGTPTVFRPYAADAKKAQIEAEIVNSGEIMATYLVTVRACSGDIAPVPFQYVTVMYMGSETLPFDLRTDTALTEGDTCRVQLQAPTGRLFHEIVVTFPGPS